MEAIEELTNLEELMMRCIWEHEGEMPFLQMGKDLKEKFHKEYKRTSIRGYLFRLEDKGYIKVERRGRNSYIQPLVKEEEYGKKQAEKVVDTWFNGSAEEFFCALGKKITKEEGEQLKQMLDEMDFDE